MTIPKLKASCEYQLFQTRPDVAYDASISGFLHLSTQNPLFFIPLRTHSLLYTQR